MQLMEELDKKSKNGQRGKRYKIMKGKASKKTTRSAVVVEGLAELMNRLTLEEKCELVRIMNWSELDRLREEAESILHRTRLGDPKVYVERTDEGLNFEAPPEKVSKFLEELVRYLSPKKIEIYLMRDGGFEELSFPLKEFMNYLGVSQEIIANHYAMIDFDSYTLISGGGGCLSLTLLGVANEVVREIAEQFLGICGYPYKFSKDEFSAIVWTDKLEVKE